MKNLKNLVAGIILTAALMIGTGTANAGLLVSDFAPTTPQPCSENTNWGVIVQGFTGVIVQGFTGVIVQGATETVNCGILLGD